MAFVQGIVRRILTGYIVCPGFNFTADYVVFVVYKNNFAEDLVYILGAYHNPVRLKASVHLFPGKYIVVVQVGHIFPQATVIQCKNFKFTAFFDTCITCRIILVTHTGERPYTADIRRLFKAVDKPFPSLAALVKALRRGVCTQTEKGNKGIHCTQNADGGIFFHLFA